jgi:PAS domain S-box-containing protein
MLDAAPQPAAALVQRSMQQAMLASRLLAGIVMLLGVCVLFGWWLDIPAIRTVLPGLISMKFNTAAGFVLCGLAVLALSLERPASDRLARALGALALLLGGVTLSQYMFGWNLGVDTLLFDVKRISDETSSRMAPVTALCFMLCGAALAAGPGRRSERWSQRGTLLAGTLALLGFFGYLIDVQALYRLTANFSMAAHTTAGFLLLSAAIVQARHQQCSLTQWTRLTTAIALAAHLALGWTIVDRLRDLSSADQWEGHTQQVLLALEQSFGALVDAESAQRGYIVTGNAQQRQRYEQAQDLLTQRLLILRQLMADNPAQQRRLADAQLLIRAKLAHMDSDIDALNKLQPQTMKSLRATMGDSLESGYLVRIRQQFGALEAEEQRLLAARLASKVDESRRVVQTLTVAGIFVALTILAVFLLLWAAIARRQRADAALALQRDQLEAQVAQRTAHLATREQDLRLALLSADLGTWSYTVGTDAVDASARCREMFGFKHDETVGLARFMTRLHPADQAGFQNDLQQAVATLQEFHNEYRVLWPDGSLHWIAASGGATVADAADAQQASARRICGVVLDQTERRNNEEALRASEAKFSLLFNQGALPVVLTRWSDHVLVDVNDAWLRLFGYARAELIGKSAIELSMTPGAAGINTGSISVHNLEQTLFSKSGEPINVLTNINLVTIAEQDFALRSDYDITERRKTENELRLHRDHLEALVSERTLDLEAARVRIENFILLVPIAICVLEDGRISLRNAQFTRLFGYTEQDIPTIDAWRSHAYPDPAYRAWVQRNWAEAVALAGIENRATSPCEYLVTCSDGSVRNIEVSGASLDKVFLATFYDVTERRRIEAAIAESEHFLRTITDAVPGMVGYWSSDLRCRFANNGYQEWYGWKPKNLLGASLQDMMGETLFRQTEPYIRAALRGERQQFERVINKANGEPGNQWVHYIPDQVNGDIRGFFVLISDVTTLKKTQLELERANLDLMSRTADAEAANCAKSDFLATMSHEIRTPMNAILGSAQVLERADLGPDQRQLVGAIRSAGRGLLAILNDVLDFAKIEAGHFTLESYPFVLSNVLSNLLDVLSPSAANQGLRLDLAPLPAGVDALLGDAHRLGQVLYNLTGNAIKFTPKGGVSVSVSVVSPLPQQHAGSVMLRFAVRDSGIGIAPDQIERLFDAFVQADASTSRQYGGTGLGLAICRQIVTLMGGEIGAASTPGSGSEFWFTAPFDVAQGAVARAVTASPQDSAGARLAGLRLLVVDDSHVNQIIARNLLALEGACCDMADHGRAALDRLIAGPHDFDCVLMDVQMPVMDGLIATQAIRSELGLADLPIIALTAGVLPSQRARALAAGMNDFIAKPFELDAMVAAILRHASVSMAPAVAFEAGLQVELETGPAPAGDHDFPSVPGVDSRSAARRLLGDREFFVGALRALRDEFVDVAQQTRFDFARGDAPSAARRLHKLRGVAGNVAANQIAALAGELEEMLRSEPPALGLPELAALATALELLIAGLPAGIDAPPTPALPAPANGPSLMPVRIEDIKDILVLLADGDMAACKRFQSMRPELAAHHGDAQLTRLSTDIDMLRFDEVYAQLLAWYPSAPSAKN